MNSFENLKRLRESIYSLKKLEEEMEKALIEEMSKENNPWKFFSVKKLDWVEIPSEEDFWVLADNQQMVKAVCWMHERLPWKNESLSVLHEMAKALCEMHFHQS